MLSKVVTGNQAVQMEQEQRYGIREFALRVGVSVSTLRRWDKAGLLVAGRTPTHRMVYGERHLRQLLRLETGQDEQSRKG